MRVMFRNLQKRSCREYFCGALSSAIFVAKTEHQTSILVDLRKHRQNLRL